jgi:hypothetical protein
MALEDGKDMADRHMVHTDQEALKKHNEAAHKQNENREQIAELLQGETANAGEKDIDEKVE